MQIQYKKYDKYPPKNIIYALQNSKKMISLVNQLNSMKLNRIVTNINAKLKTRTEINIAEI